MMAVLLPFIAYAATVDQQDVVDSIRVIDVDKAGQLQFSGPIAIRYDLSADSVYTQQLMAIQFQLDSNDAYISLRIDIEPEADESYRLLGIRKTVLPETSRHRYRYLFKVLYKTAQSGALALTIPDLIYSEGGRDNYRLRFASQRLQVKPLPEYLPPYITMSAVDLESSISTPATWYRPLDTGRVYYWNIVITGIGLDAQSMPDIRQQINNKPGLRFLPPILSAATEVSPDDSVQKIRYSIPFIADSSGLLQLPDIRLHYFDTGKQRLVSKHYVQERLTVLSATIFWLLILVIAAIVVMLWRRLRQPVSRACRNIYDLYHARRQLQHAQTGQQMRAAMNRLGESLGWPANPTLSEWLQYWRQDIHLDGSIADHVHALSAQLYGPASKSDDVGELRALLLSTLPKQFWRCIKASL